MSLALFSQHFSLSGRTVVLLGGAGVMGGAMAEAAARAGADLIIAGRSGARGHACVERVRSCGGVGGYSPVDLSQPATLPKLIDYALGEYGKIDALLQVASPTWSSEWLVRAGKAFQQAMQDDDPVVVSVAPDSLELPASLVGQTITVPHDEEAGDATREAAIAVALTLLRHGSQLEPNIYRLS